MKISELPQATELTGEELVPVVQNGETKKVTRADFVGDVPDGIVIKDNTIALFSNGKKIGESAPLPKITVDSELSNESKNPVQNKVIKGELDKKLEDSDGAVKSSNLADNCVNENKIADGSVTEEKLSEEVKEKLNKSQALVNNVANAVKGKAVGESLLINDVSPIEHAMDITISSVTDADIEGVEVVCTGKNMLNPDAENSQKVNSTYYGMDTTYLNGKNVQLCIKLKEGKDIPKQSFGIAFYTAAGVLQLNYLVNAEGALLATSTDVLKRANTEKPSAVIVGGNGTKTKAHWDKIFDAFDVQLEMGTKDTEYVPFQGEHIAISDEDGKVEGLTTFYPEMSIVAKTPNVVIHCEYNKDLNKFIEQLTQAILSLGGNV